MQKLEMDIIDEQIDTLGKAFMGMTLGCVRCHDHKFDPITQEDYYAMAAIFRSTRSLAPEKMGSIKFWYEHSLATPEQLEEKKKFDEALKAKKAEAREIHCGRAERGESGAAKAGGGLSRRRGTACRRSRRWRLPMCCLWPGRMSWMPISCLLCRQFLDRQPDDHPIFSRWRELAAKQDADGIREHYAPLFAEALELEERVRLTTR